MAGRLRKALYLAALTLAGLALCGFSGSGGGGSFNGGTIGQGLTNNGGTAQVGSTVISGIGQPSAPTVTPNTTGSTTATYYCDALDLNGLTNLTGGIGNTIPSAVTTITNGAATPNTTVKCGGQTGALGYVVTKGATGGATSFLGSCLTLGSGNSCSVTDTGQALTTYTANSNDETGDLSVKSAVHLTGASGASADLFGFPEGQGDDLTINLRGNTAVTADYGGDGMRNWRFWVHEQHGDALKPSLGACGTGPTLNTHSQDNGGEVTTGTSATTCAVAFGSAFGTDAFCTATDATAAHTLWISAHSTTGFTVSGLTAGDVFEYTCMGAQN